ncbi:MAG: hypothetical protein U0869_10210 [Chloroflexota bacterium]
MTARPVSLAPRHRAVRAGLPALGLVALLVALPAPASAAVTVPGAPACTVFPDSNVWNKRVDRLPVRSDSEKLKRTIGLGASLHPDFSDADADGYGIPYQVVDAGTPRSTVSFTWPEESDAGPYPIPDAPLIEGGSDRHLLMLDKDACRLYELYAAHKKNDGSWAAGSGAIWDLGSNALRHRGWTSADAAGLPILPGLARYDEVAAGAILHALRFTVPETRKAFIYPARHQASDLTGTRYPPMGLRVRLKRSVDISGFPPQARIVLRALKRYGMILADNGSSWYVTGAPDPGWDDDDLHTLGRITGRDFEVVDTSSLRNG